MKISKNSPCPCSSGKKYKDCCYKWHKIGSAPNALLLMRSRYSAYAVGNAEYIIKTTHPNSPHYERNLNEWKKSIKDFSNSDFKKLEIIEFIDGKKEAYVEFKAYIDDYIMHERSKFLKNDKWYYFDGENPQKED
jgi:SEC-C motif-containing protein